MLGLGIGNIIETSDYAVEAIGYDTNTHSLNLDGDGDYLNTQTTLQTQLRGSFTVMGWFKLDDGRPSNTKYFFGANKTNNYISLNLGTTGALAVSHNSNSDQALYITGSLFADGAADWTHLAIVVTKNSGSNTSYTVYKDGIPKGGTLYFSVSEANHNAYTSDTEFAFGTIGNPSVSTYGTDGLVDECAFFDDALSSGEILAIYNSGVPTDITGHDHLYLYYKLNNSVTDEVGNSNGALVGDAAYSTTVPS